MSINVKSFIMKTKKVFDGFCCSASAIILAIVAMFIPFCLAADVLEASVFDFSALYKIGVVILFVIALFMMHRQAKLA